MANYKEDEKLIKDFMESGKLVKDKLTIIDLRDNGGGSNEYPKEWFKNYAGEEPQLYAMICHLYTNTVVTKINKQCSVSNYSEEMKKKYNDYAEGIKTLHNFPGWNEMYISNPEFINNNNLVIVIINNNVASAGEDFVNMLRLFNNAIFVGTNTNRVELIGNNYLSNLPNSNLFIRCGYTISDINVQEGVGYLPDFWVNPNDAIDRVIKFINKYDTSSLKIKR